MHYVGSVVTVTNHHNHYQHGACEIGVVLICWLPFIFDHRPHISVVCRPGVVKHFPGFFENYVNIMSRLVVMLGRKVAAKHPTSAGCVSFPPKTDSGECAYCNKVGTILSALGTGQINTVYTATMVLR